jgi:hypothetical protein
LLAKSDRQSQNLFSSKGRGRHVANDSRLAEKRRPIRWGTLQRPLPAHPSRLSDNACRLEPLALATRAEDSSFGAAIIEKFFLLPNWENVNISYIIGRPAMMGKADRLPP